MRIKMIQQPRGSRNGLVLQAVLGLVVLTSGGGPADASDWYVAPGGTATAAGTIDAPWDIESALAGKHRIAPGDRVLLRSGTYRRRPQEQFLVRLAGTEGKPVEVLAVPGERVRIDGGLRVDTASAHLWIRDLEIFVSEPQPDKPLGPGSNPRDYTRPRGGLNINGGINCKYLDLVIHDCSQGVSWWTGSRDSELYGCIIYDNGWPAVDRGHGHAIYTQNNEGTKTIADCIMTGGHGYTVHAYGSARADVNNYLIEGNLCYNAHTFLLGGGKPSKNIRVIRNYLYGVPMQIGYNAPYNEDCEVRDNLIVDGSLQIQKYRKAVNEGNAILNKQAKRPPGACVVLLPNRYDPARANLAVFNWDRKPVVAVEPGIFLKEGERFRLVDPCDFFGEPVLAGRYDGKSIPVPLKGEFAAFVLLKGEPRSRESTRPPSR
jgi:hypothetical protein